MTLDGQEESQIQIVGRDGSVFFSDIAIKIKATIPGFFYRNDKPKVTSLLNLFRIRLRAFPTHLNFFSLKIIRPILILKFQLVSGYFQSLKAPELLRRALTPGGGSTPALTTVASSNPCRGKFSNISKLNITYPNRKRNS